jgi:hypothetical protein
MVESGWYGFDLDGTIAHYDGFKGVDHVGEPIWPMVNLMKSYIAKGQSVRIFTARVSPSAIIGRAAIDSTDKAAVDEAIRKAVQPILDWSIQNIGHMVPITCQKDFSMIALYDDRAIQIVPNEGRRADGLPLE